MMLGQCVRSGRDLGAACEARHSVLARFSSSVVLTKSLKDLGSEFFAQGPYNLWLGRCGGDHDPLQRRQVVLGRDRILRQRYCNRRYHGDSYDSVLLYRLEHPNEVVLGHPDRRHSGDGVHDANLGMRVYSKQFCVSLDQGSRRWDEHE